MKKVILSFIAFILIAVLLISCKGDTGPAGATGPTGPTGATGATGPTGNANVKVDTFTVANASWLWNSSYVIQTSGGGSTARFTRYYDRSYTAVTADILNTGMLLVYFTPNPGGNFGGSAIQWSPLDYSYLAFGSQYYYNVAYETSVGKVRLHYFYTPNGSAGTVPTDLSTAVLPSYKFKIVAVAGAIGGRFTSGPAVGYTIEQLKSMPYETVCQILNIKP